ncbi:hypothetical protein M758_10G019700 [Ceratodon purpureus]|nr:hypothetical protein M758_10G019700 [Ceratodon purpureus]
MHDNLGLQIVSCWVLSQKGCFKQRTRISHGTFRFLCKKLSQFVEKNDTCMRSNISVETRIAVSLCRWGTRNGLLLIREVYGIAECRASCVVKEFCKVVKKYFIKSFSPIF